MGSRSGSRGGRSRGSNAQIDGGEQQKPKSWRAPLELPSQVEGVAAPSWFVEKCSAMGVEFESGEVERLGRFLALLMAANRVVNLTAIRDAEAGWERHIFDSLSLLPVLAEAEAAGDGLRVIDVGSGGGLPGLPLAICLPEISFTLLDSTEKKCRFMEHAASEIGLTNVRVVHDRAERAGHERGARVDSGGVARREGAMRGAFDVVTARAVGPMATLVELASPFARVGGLVALTKGQKADEELAEAKGALHMLHLSHAGTVETETGRIVVLEKRRETPKMYPRGDGEPKRRPLGVAGSDA